MGYIARDLGQRTLTDSFSQVRYAVALEVGTATWLRDDEANGSTAGVAGGSLTELP